MSCTKTIKSNFLSGYSSGGTLELEGYTTDGSGTPDPTGGNWPWTTNTESDPSVNFNNIISGYYHLKHYGGGDPESACYGEVQFIIPVAQGGNAGVDATTTICENDAPISPAGILGTIFDKDAAIPPEFEWSGDITGAGWSSGAGEEPSDATFDPGLSGTGTFVIVLDITPATPAGYTKVTGCSNCDATQAEITIIVEAEFNAGTAESVAACNDGDI